MLTEKYKPSKILEVIGQGEGMRQLTSFIRSETGAVIVHGPVGCGKTSSVYAIASELGYEIVELNAGDLRDRGQVKDIIGNALTQRSLFFKKKVILIDEIDNLTAHDYGGVGEITALIDMNSYPVIMCANKPFEKKLMGLRKKARLIEFKRVDAIGIISILKRICDKEGIKYTDNVLKQIALLSGGDIRAAINDLQAQGKDITEVIVSKRDQEESIYNALKMIFKGKSFSVLNALDNVDLDLGESMMWIDENLPLEYSKKDLHAAYQAMSKADVFYRRIRRQQHWRFLVYVMAMLTAGVSFAKTRESSNYSPYRRSNRMLKMWMANSASRKAVAEKVAKEVHCSTKKLMKEMAYIKLICQDKKTKDSVMQELNLNKEEFELLLGKSR